MYTLTPSARYISDNYFMYLWCSKEGDTEGSADHQEGNELATEIHPWICCPATRSWQSLKIRANGLKTKSEASLQFLQKNCFYAIWKKLCSRKFLPTIFILVHLIPLCITHIFHQLSDFGINYIILNLVQILVTVNKVHSHSVSSVRLVDGF